MRSYRRIFTPDGLVFLVLLVFSLSNVFAWPDALLAYRDFTSHVLANSILNAPENRNMDKFIIPAYLLMTSSTNFVVSRVLRPMNWVRLLLFAALFVVGSVAVSVAAIAVFLAG